MTGITTKASSQLCASENEEGKNVTNGHRAGNTETRDGGMFFVAVLNTDAGLATLRAAFPLHVLALLAIATRIEHQANQNQRHGD